MDRSEQQVCVGCGVVPPKTKTNYTLIEHYGWRLTIASSRDGKRKPELRCPSCWAAHRERGGGVGDPKEAPSPPARRQLR
jgi:hypothetical protein